MLIGHEMMIDDACVTSSDRALSKLYFEPSLSKTTSKRIIHAVVP